jgi:hypothetical protein
MYLLLCVTNLHMCTSIVLSTYHALLFHSKSKNCACVCVGGMLQFWLTDGSKTPYAANHNITSIQRGKAYKGNGRQKGVSGVMVVVGRLLLLCQAWCLDDLMIHFISAEPKLGGNPDLYQRHHLSL